MKMSAYKLPQELIDYQNGKSHQPVFKVMMRDALVHANVSIMVEWRGDNLDP